MVVSGNITADEIFKMAEKYIEPNPSACSAATRHTKEPDQIGERRLVVKKFAQLPMLMSVTTFGKREGPDYYALKFADSTFRGAKAHECINVWLIQTNWRYQSQRLPVCVRSDSVRHNRSAERQCQPDKVERSFTRNWTAKTSFDF